MTGDYHFVDAEKGAWLGGRSERMEEGVVSSENEMVLWREIVTTLVNSDHFIKFLRTTIFPVDN